MRRLCVGVLSLQGCVQPHRAHLESLNVIFKEVKRPEDLDEPTSIDGLILPGGESTAMLKIIKNFALEGPLKKAFDRVPVWGICAGAILMAKQVHSPSQRSFGLLDITVERNSYGRQVNSFNAPVRNYPVSFIRAPRILSIGAGVQIEEEREGHPIWVRSGSRMATTFHPELNQSVPSPMHEAFLKLIEKG